jgi:hypothetical protein
MQCLVTILMVLSAFSVVKAQTYEDLLVVALDPTYATDWMDLVYRRVEAEKQSAPLASRTYGYAGVALYESLLGGMPNNRTLAGQITHMPDLPYAEFDENAIFDWISMMDATMSVVLPTLFLNPSDETLQAFADLRAQHSADRAKVHDQEVIDRSLAFGEDIGEVLVEWIEGDYFESLHADGLNYEMPVGEGSYQLTTEGSQPAEPYWGQLRPFVLQGGYDCNVAPDVFYNIDPESVYYKQALEVVEAERNLTEWEKETARYWVDTPGITGTPAGHWISIATQLVDQLDLDLQRTAMMYAMVGMAVADSFISTWYNKYVFNTVRPETFIREHIRQRWTPYIQTPPFPEYPSGHSVVSMAAAETLTNLLGTQVFTDETHIIYGHELFARSYTSFVAAASEAAISRLYGGIHYRYAIENGMEQGRCIGEYLRQRIRLNPVLQGE